MLFADLVGSTELGGALDPEYTRDLLDRFYDAMEAEIALGGGTVEKFIGDAVVALELGEPATVEAKGKEGGVAARELIRMIAPRRTRGGRGLRTAFVGRERELEKLAAELQLCRNANGPRLVTLVGEPGVGKT